MQTKMAAMRIIYADSALVLNFVIDYLLLLSTGKVCALPLVRWRMALAALFGGVYAVLSLVYPQLLTLAACKIFSGLALAAIAFGGLDRFIRTAAVFFAVSAAFGGAVYAALSIGGVDVSKALALPLSTRTLTLSFALCYTVLSVVFRGAARRTDAEYGYIEILLRDKKVSFKALRDTGNELRDSKGAPVVVAEWAAAAALFPEFDKQPSLDPPYLLLEMDALEGMKGRGSLLPCLTATDAGGLLPCFRPDAISINGKKAQHCLLALIPGPISSDGSYRALY